MRGRRNSGPWLCFVGTVFIFNATVVQAAGIHLDLVHSLCSCSSAWGRPSFVGM